MAKVRNLGDQKAAILGYLKKTRGVGQNEVPDNTNRVIPVRWNIFKALERLQSALKTAEGKCVVQKLSQEDKQLLVDSVWRAQKEVESLSPTSMNSELAAVRSIMSEMWSPLTVIAQVSPKEQLTSQNVEDATAFSTFFTALASKIPVGRVSVDYNYVPSELNIDESYATPEIKAAESNGNGTGVGTKLGAILSPDVGSEVIKSPAELLAKDVGTGNMINVALDLDDNQQRILGLEQILLSDLEEIDNAQGIRESKCQDTGGVDVPAKYVPKLVEMIDQALKDIDRLKNTGKELSNQIDVDAVKLSEDISSKIDMFNADVSRVAENVKAIDRGTILYAYGQSRPWGYNSPLYANPYNAPVEGEEHIFSKSMPKTWDNGSFNNWSAYPGIRLKHQPIGSLSGGDEAKWAQGVFLTAGAVLLGAGYLVYKYYIKPKYLK